jgi:hypothetical protein
MENIYFLDLPELSSIPNAYQKDYSELMRICAHKLRNFAFREAVSGLINVGSAIMGGYSILRPILDDQNASNSKVVIARANWLEVSQQYEESH